MFLYVCVSVCVWVYVCTGRYIASSVAGSQMENGFNIWSFQVCGCHRANMHYAGFRVVQAYLPEPVVLLEACAWYSPAPLQSMCLTMCPPCVCVCVCVCVLCTTLQGKLLYASSKEQLFQFSWRPRLPSLLSAEKEAEIVKNLKQYSKK